MARQARHTEPIETKIGPLTSYEEINTHLVAGEARGREWLWTRAKDKAFAGRVPTDFDVLALHEAMFVPLFEWAGQTRKCDVGPGGQLFVHWTDVPAQLRNLSLDAAHWMPVDEDVSLSSIGAFIAKFHHRFQRVHPFLDTNGRTGRALDHYLFWVTFELVGSTLERSPMLEYFPTEVHEDAYYDGLRAADGGDIARLSDFYQERLGAALLQGTST